MTLYKPLTDLQLGQDVTLEEWRALQQDINFGGLVPIADQTLGVSATIVTFSNISQKYETLIAIIYARGSAAIEFTDMNMRFNGDSGANYDSRYKFSTSTTLASAEVMAAAGGYMANIPCASAPANSFNGVVQFFPCYSFSGVQKSVTSKWSLKVTTAPNMRAGEYNAWWRNYSPITSISYLIVAGGGDFVVGSRFSLYGMGGF